MKKENFFKANLNESELPSFLAELDDDEQERFLEILNSESFELVNVEVAACEDEWFFANAVIAYDYERKLFAEQTYDVIDEYAYNYNVALYENAGEPASYGKRVATNQVWQEYTNFIVDIADCFEYKHKVAKDAGDNKLIEIFDEITDELDDFFYSGDLEYFKCDSYHNWTINENRVDVIDAITKIKEFAQRYGDMIDIELYFSDAVVEPDYNFQACPSAQKIITQADELLKKAENGAIIDNSVSFKWLFDNDMICRDKQDREL